MVVIVPSRGRPENMRELIGAWRETGASALLVAGVDDDDPTWVKYPLFPMDDTPYLLERGLRMGMCGTLNDIASRSVATERYDYVGFMGDDHRPRTVGWDGSICEALDGLGTGVVYGNDLFQGPNLPTAVFVTADIVRSLGYMAPPCLKHMFLDNFWLDLGNLVGIKYLPNVVIEHMHPQAGKAEMDDGYADVWPLMERDRQAYEHYVDSGQFSNDVEKVRRGSATVR